MKSNQERKEHIQKELDSYPYELFYILGVDWYENNLSTEIQNLESTLLNADIVLKVKSNGNNLHYFKEIMQQAEIIEVFKGSGFEINQIIDIITPFRVLLFDDLGVTGSYNDFLKKIMSTCCLLKRYRLI